MSVPAASAMCRLIRDVDPGLDPALRLRPDGPYRLRSPTKSMNAIMEHEEDARARGATREPRARPRSGDRRARRPQPGAGSAPAARLTSARRCSRKARSAAFDVSSIARWYD